MPSRGEIWTVAGGLGYASKPRPAVIVQDARFADTDSVTICGITSDPTEAPLFRLEVEPCAASGRKARDPSKSPELVIHLDTNFFESIPNLKVLSY